MLSMMLLQAGISEYDAVNDDADDAPASRNLRVRLTLLDRIIYSNSYYA